METTTYNSNAMGNLWSYLQGLSLSAADRRWLAGRLIESTRDEEDELLTQARKAIDELRMLSEKNGNSEMTLEEINAEIQQARQECKKRQTVKR